ncbi:MAG: choice-of-anchor D domain-containing protein [Terriglobales bacterium]
MALAQPGAVARDAAGDVFIADTGRGEIEELTAGKIEVIAGGGAAMPGAAPAAATSVSLSSPAGVASAGGDVYIADTGHGLVEEVDASGMITVVAGGGTTPPGLSPEPATQAKLAAPAGLATDAAGDLFIADAGANVVDELTASGQIVVFAGGGTTVPTTTAPISPTGAELSDPIALASDAASDLYIADRGHGIVERVDAATGLLALFAGNGVAAPTTTPGSLNSVRLAAPSGLAVGPRGNLWIADGAGHVLEAPAATGQILVVAGGGATAPSDAPEPATSAQLPATGTIALGAGPAGGLLVADGGDNLVESIATNAIFPPTPVGATVSQTVAIQLTQATPISAIVPVPAGSTEFTAGAVTGCATDGTTANVAGAICLVTATFHPGGPGMRAGSLAVEDNGLAVGTVGLYGLGQAPRVSVGPGALTQIGGGGTAIPTTTPEPAASAQLEADAVAAAPGGQVYIADAGQNLVEKMNLASGQIAVVAGGGSSYPGFGAQPALSAELRFPFGVAVDGAGNLYIADWGNGYVDKVDATTQELAVVAGGGTVPPAPGDPEPATSARIFPSGIAVDAQGDIYIADSGNNQIERVDAASGTITVIAGGGATVPTFTPEPATSAKLFSPYGLALGPAGQLYIADWGNNLVEKLDLATGSIAAIAGGGGTPPTTTPEPASEAALYAPYWVAADPAGDVFVSDSLHNQVEEVPAASGQIQVIAGSGSASPGATPQPAATVAVADPEGLAFDAAGNLFLIAYTSTSGSSAIVDEIQPTAPPLVFPATAIGSSSASQSLSITNTGNQTATLSGLTAAPDFPNQPAGTCALAPDSGQTLPAGASCSLAYALVPTTAGTLQETAVLSDNSLNAAAEQNISLSGNGLGPVAAAAPAGLTFPATGVGVTAAAQTVTLSNSGNEPLGVSAIQGSGDFSVTNDCGAALQARAQCAISVAFKPAATGNRTGTLTVRDNSGNDASAVQSVALSGQGVADVALAAAPGAPTSQSVAAGQTAQFSLTLAPQGGFTGAVALACSVAPATPTVACSLGADSVTLAAGTTAKLTVTVTTIAASIFAPARSGGPGNDAGILLLLAGALLGLGVAARFYRRRVPALASFGLALVLVLAACGGGSTAAAPAAPSHPGTPPGTYQLTVTAAGPGGSQQIPLTLTVQ